MTITSIFEKDSSYLELQNKHIEYCIADLVDLFTVAALSYERGIDHYTQFAALMMDIRSSERNYMPASPVDMKGQMILANLGMFNIIWKNIEQSLASPPIGKEDPAMIRTHAKNFVLRDTSAAIRLALADVLSNPENLKMIATLSACSETRLAASIRAFLEEKYRAPSNQDLSGAITERWLAFGVDPTQRNQGQPYYSAPRYA